MLDRRSTACPGRAPHSAAPPPRSRGARVLRRQGAPPARPHPARGAASSCACAPSSTRRARHGGLGAPHARQLPGQGAGDDARQALVTVAGNGMWACPASPRARSRRSRARCRSRQSCSRRPRARSVHAARGRAARAVRALETAFQRNRPQGSSTASTSRTAWRWSRWWDGIAGTRAWPRECSPPRRAGVNVVAIAQGSSELEHLVRRRRPAPSRARGARRLPALEDRRRPPPRSAYTDVVLLGFGRVGRALADDGRGVGRRQRRLVAALDRSGYVFEPRGARAPARSSRPARRRDAPGRAGGARVGRRRAAVDRRPRRLAPVLVDVTAEETSALLIARSGRASTSCSRTRARWPGHPRRTAACSRR